MRWDFGGERLEGDGANVVWGMGRVAWAWAFCWCRLGSDCCDTPH